MTDLLAQYGPLGAIAVILAGVVATIVRQQRRATPPRIVLDFTGFAEQLRPLLDVRAEMKELRVEIRNDLQPLVTKVAVLEHRIGDVERRGVER